MQLPQTVEVKEIRVLTSKQIAEEILELLQV